MEKKMVKLGRLEKKSFFIESIFLKVALKQMKGRNIFWFEDWKCSTEEGIYLSTNPDEQRKYTSNYIKVIGVSTTVPIIEVLN